MRSTAVSLIVFLFCLSACGDAEPESELTVSGDVVEIALYLANDVCDVTSADVTITAPDITTIGPASLNVAGDLISGSVASVPAGVDRLVTVNGYNAGGLLVYGGSTSIDVVMGKTTRASLRLQRNLSNCPAAGMDASAADAGTGVVDVVATLDNGDGNHILDFRVTDAEYSTALDRIVFVTSSPAELRLFDPVTGDSQGVGLQVAPTAVSVSPDGLHAVVGHDGWLSYVDLGTLALDNTIPITADAFDVVLGGNDHAYVFPRDGQWTQIHSVAMTTGVETTGGGIIRQGTVARLHPTTSAIYGADNGLSPSDIEKYDISTGTATVLYDSPYHGDHAMCGDLWLSRDGLRIYTRCGNTFRADTNQSQDMTYAGSLPSLSRIQSLDHTLTSNLVASIPGNTYNTTNADQEVRFFGHQFLSYVSTTPLEKVSLGGTDWASHGRYVFFRSDGTAVYVVAQVDPSAGMLHDNIVLTLTPPY